jgi:hypothetical protein
MNQIPASAKKPRTARVLMFDVSLPWANFWYDAFNVMLFIGAFAVAVGTYGSIKMGAVKEKFSDERTTALETQTEQAKAELGKANEGIAKAQQNTAAANERTAQLELALEKERNARLPRSISAEQRAGLLAALKAAPKGNVFVIGSFFDAESRQYAEQILSVMTEAGFDTTEMPARPDKPIGYTSPGAWLWLRDVPTAPPHAAPIQRAFQAAGIYLDGQSHPDLLEADEVLIAVSSHP